MKFVNLIWLNVKSCTVGWGNRIISEDIHYFMTIWYREPMSIMIEKIKTPADRVSACLNLCLRMCLCVCMSACVFVVNLLYFQSQLQYDYERLWPLTDLRLWLIHAVMKPRLNISNILKYWSELFSYQSIGLLTALLKHGWNDSN